MDCPIPSLTIQRTVLINKITYPTGASVTYTWGTNVNAESMGFGNAFGATSGTVEPVAGTGPWFWNGGPPTANSTFCNFHHDFPAITKRVVSYDGVNPAMEQDFSYSTNWTNPTDFQWATKQTTVTTIDLLRPGHPSFKTVYNYNFGVNFPVTLGHITTSGVPQESTIVYYDTSGSVLKTTVEVWSGPYAEAQLAGECTILPNGLVSGIFYSYQTYPNDYAQSGTSPYLPQTDVKNDIAEFDYGAVNSTCTRPSTTPSRETVITYATFVQLRPFRSIRSHRAALIAIVYRACGENLLRSRPMITERWLQKQTMSTTNLLYHRFHQPPLTTTREVTVPVRLYRAAMPRRSQRSASPSVKLVQIL